MGTQKPNLPKGTRDFGPEKMVKRNFIFDAIKGTFQKFGFQPLETPAIENLSVLTGKYGDEGDQLLFKILNSGDFLSKTSPEDLESGSRTLLPKISEKGMKYDLTVPFARYVVMNQHNITFPFKRYQIQPVWRADRPQKGRYREFYQCDADVIGTDSLICESEIILMIKEVFGKLGIQKYDIKINNRKILGAIANYIGVPGKISDFCVAIDKLDKIGLEGVLKELEKRSFPKESLKKLGPIINFSGSNEEKISFLGKLISEEQEGISEIKQIFGFLQSFGTDAEHVDFDPTLARGLSYYTGTIFEVKVKDVSIGSVSGGGRYDDLTGIFGLPGVSGVGFSFGVDRIYDVMEELDLFPKDNLISTKVLIANFGADSEKHALTTLKKLRDTEIKSEIYPDAVKLKKQLNYADKKAIPFVIMIGEDEIKNGSFTLKDMQKGQQERLDLEALLNKLKD
ncbi:histidine--tRNA ligase [Fulvivirgaceae bacterium BMA10]|uniref:Histidine--tRNA ligase n=1 Tax=Splendidivirga corallicola TaxID=3051826 RepID=A0ABT8KKX2_9BACT|nr:histidine--tRNA ligase [Fulvivirgaceae bacterium BMA10]